MSVLRIEQATKAFGGLVAVDHVSFELAVQGISGLVGPNGSGKTTLFHLISGFYKLDSGSIYYRDVPISGLPPHVISRMGLVRTFQQTRVLPFMTTLDNLMASAPDQAGERLSAVFFERGKVKQEETRYRERAHEILDKLQLGRVANELAGNLSYGQQRLLELGRVLMARPKIVLLDEPTAGINPTLIRKIMEILMQLRDQGIKIFLIEHNMPFVSEMCDEVFVLDAGKLIFHGTPQQARRDQGVIDAYLGREEHAA